MGFRWVWFFRGFERLGVAKKLGFKHVGVAKPENGKPLLTAVPTCGRLG